MQFAVPKRFLSLSLALLLGGGCSDDSPSGPTPPDPPSPTTTIQLDDPGRGAMLSSGTEDPSPVTLSGSACDPESPLRALEIDGQVLTLAGTRPCEDFSVEHLSPWGFNLVEGSATNETGFTSTLTHSFLRSPRYFDPGVSSKRRRIGEPEKAEHAFYLRMSSDFVDDHTAGSLDDVKSLMNAVLSGVSLNDYMPTVVRPHPGTTFCDCLLRDDITIDNTGLRILRLPASHGPLTVDSIELAQDELTLAISVENLAIPIKATGYLSSCATACPAQGWTVEDVYGTVRVDEVRATLRLGVNGVSAAGVPQLSVCGTCVQVQTVNAQLDIDWGGLGFLDGILNFPDITSQVLVFFENTLDSEFPDLLTPYAQDMFDEVFTSLALPEAVPLAPPLDVELTVATQLDLLEIHPDGIRMALAASVSAATPVRSSPRGPLFRGGSLPTFPATGYEVGMAPKDDLLNQFLWAAWQGGAFDVDDLSGLGVPLPQGVQMRASTSLPPALMPGSGEYEVRIGLGDVFLEVLVGETTIASLYASAVMGANIGYDSAENLLLLELEDNPDISVQIVEAPEGSDPATLSAEYAEIFRGVALNLLTAVVGRIPIPTFDIGAQGIAGIPADLSWGVANGGIQRQDPYYLVTGGLAIE